MLLNKVSDIKDEVIIKRPANWPVFLFSNLDGCKSYYLDKKKPFRRNGTASTIACHIKKSYFLVVSAAALAAESTVAPAESTVTGATTVVSTVVAAAVSAVASVSDDPPQEARAAIARIASTFFIP